MKKIFVTLMLFLGITTQAQTFDFTCAPDLLDYTLEIVIGKGDSLKTLTATKTFSSDEANDELLTFTFDIPEGYQVSSNYKSFNTTLYGGFSVTIKDFSVEDTSFNVTVQPPNSINYNLTPLTNKLTIANTFISLTPEANKSTNVIITYIQGHGQPNIVDTITIEEPPELTGYETSIVYLTGGLEFIEMQSFLGENLGITGISYGVSVNDFAITSISLANSFKANGVDIPITVDLSSYIQPLENNVVVGVDLVGLTLTSSHTFTSDNDGEVITLTYQVPEGYTVTSYIGPSEDFTPAGSEFTIAPAGDVGLNHTSFSLHVTPPATIDYSDTETELSIDLSKFITKDGNTLSLNGVDISIGDSHTEWVFIEEYNGGIEIIIDGTKYTFTPDYEDETFDIAENVQIEVDEGYNWNLILTNITADKTITWSKL